MAVIHAYVWTKGAGYPGAPEGSRLKNIKPRLRGWDVVVIGDNHIPFDIIGAGPGFPAVYGCGGFYRRRADEANHRPSVGLLKSDGTIKRHYLDVSQDKFLEPSALEKLTASRNLDAAGLVEELSSLEADAVDFRAAVLRALDDRKVSRAVRSAVLEAMEEGQS